MLTSEFSNIENVHVTAFIYMSYMICLWWAA